MVSKKRLSGGIIILVAVWLFFVYEVINGNLLDHGYAVYPTQSVGTWLGAKLLGLTQYKRGK